VGKPKSGAAKLVLATEIVPEPKKAETPAHDHAHEHNHQDQAALLSLFYRLSRENNELKAAYEKLMSQTIKALLRCLEERDPYTYGHSMRVMEYSMMIGRGAKLKESDMSNLELSAMFHDIGKVGVPDCVLLKPGKLTPEEQAVIQTHPVKSGEIIGLIDAFKSAVAGVRHHHERMDGEGYPDGLSGKQIPLSARIILVADTFDAMTSTRPYRKALPIETAYAEIERYSGSQFDPEFVRVFLEEHRKLTKRESTQVKVPIRKAA